MEIKIFIIFCSSLWPIFLSLFQSSSRNSGPRFRYDQQIDPLYVHNIERKIELSFSVVFSKIEFPENSFSLVFSRFYSEKSRTGGEDEALGVPYVLGFI